MSRYQIWSGTDNIITPGAPPGQSPVHTPEQWMERHPWVKIPGAKMVITSGPINGGVAEVFDNFVAFYKRKGADIPDDWQEQVKNKTMTEEEILAAIEEFEDNPPDPEPTVAERTAAALEFLAISGLPDVSEEEVNAVATLSAAVKINGIDKEDEKDWSTAQVNYKRKLWSSAQLKVAVKKGTITATQYREITGQEYR